MPKQGYEAKVEIDELPATSGVPLTMFKSDAPQDGETAKSGHKNIFILEGLGCANCAAKMEHEIRSLPDVRSASVDFISRRLTLVTGSCDSVPDLTPRIEAVVTRIEPDVRVVLQNGSSPGARKENDYDEDDDALRTPIIKLVIGSALFAVGIIASTPSWLELSIFLASYIIVGGEVLLRAAKGIRQGQVFSEHFLMSIATIGAFAIGEYPEGVAVMLFYLVGEMFQDRAVDNSRKSITALLDIRPDYANLKVGDDLLKVSPDEVHIGDIIVVKPGEKVPLDGKVVEGYSMVDTSALTGESVPRELEPGHEILSGFVNINGVLNVEVTKDFSESTVAKILDMVQNASSRKAPTENFITKFARYYTPIVVFGALALALLPPLLIPGAQFSDWIYRALVFLVVSCPCALVISIPLGFFSGIGGASKRGILVKGSNYLEALNSAEIVVFDKTGTLTKGVFKVTEIAAGNNFTSEELLEYAAYAESYSNHPIAVSILKAYNTDIEKNRITQYQEIAGQGIKAAIGGQEVLAGNSRLMKSENIDFRGILAPGTVVYIAVNRIYAGHIVISDEVREDSAQAIRDLKSLGIKKTVMLTGDLKNVADQIGQQLGLDEVHSELLPIEKVDKFELLLQQKTASGKIIFVGDGVNDAPVLARADIGMAMGGLGSDAAIEAADIVIMHDEPSQIAAALKIARRTRTIVYQNIVFALGIKGIFLVLGAAGAASMWEAVFADTGVALLAVLNALRVMNTKSI